MHLAIKIALLCVLLLIYMKSSANIDLKIGNNFEAKLASEESVTEGLTYRRYVAQTSDNYYVLTSPLLPIADAIKTLNSVKEIGFSATSKIPKENKFSIVNNDLIGQVNFNLGYRVIWGYFENEYQAKEWEKTLAQKGLGFYVTSNTFSPGEPGNLEISILVLDPGKFVGKLVSRLANDKTIGTEKVSDIASRTNSIAAVNGGFYVFRQDQGTIGDTAGISVIEGELVSEAVQGRPALLINNQPQISYRILEDVTSKSTLTIENNIYRITGINRLPNKRFNCGYHDNNKLVPAVHDVVCHSNNEFIVFNSNYGDLSELKISDAFVFGVSEFGSAYLLPNGLPSDVPQGHTLVLVSGEQKEDLSNRLRPGQKVEISHQVFEKGKPISLGDGSFMVNGGPTLLSQFQTRIDLWEKQGWSPNSQSVGIEAQDERDDLKPSDKIGQRAAFFDSWVNKRHPRTAVGIGHNGELIVAVVYGRDPENSIGLSIYELAQLFQSLGAVDAINLDGGGSSAMYLKGKLTGKPSDKKGERKVADALLILADNKE